MYLLHYQPQETEVDAEFAAGEEERVIQDLSKLSREEKLTVSYLNSFISAVA